jgi:hypothetical protein
MFVRFRETAGRLQVSLAETRRETGRVRQSPVAGLGSIGMPPPPADRIVFWTKLHQRLAALANRIDGAAQGAILGAIHARIPMPTQDDRNVVQVEQARADAEFWETISTMRTERVEGLKSLAATVLNDAEAEQPDAVAAVKKARQAVDRLARAERGEDVGGTPALTRKDVLRITGWKMSDLRHAWRLAEIDKRGAWDDFMTEIVKPDRQREKATSRRFLNRLRRAPP